MSLEIRGIGLSDSRTSALEMEEQDKMAQFSSSSLGSKLFFLLPNSLRFAHSAQSGLFCPHFLLCSFSVKIRKRKRGKEREIVRERERERERKKSLVHRIPRRKRKKGGSESGGTKIPRAWNETCGMKERGKRMRERRCAFFILKLRLLSLPCVCVGVQSCPSLLLFIRFPRFVHKSIPRSLSLTPFLSFSSQNRVSLSFYLRRSHLRPFLNTMTENPCPGPYFSSIFLSLSLSLSLSFSFPHTHWLFWHLPNAPKYNLFSPLWPLNLLSSRVRTWLFFRFRFARFQLHFLLRKKIF